VRARAVMSIHYAGYMGSMALLWLVMLLSAAGVEGPLRTLFLLLLALSSLALGVVGAAYVVGGRRGKG